MSAIESILEAYCVIFSGKPISTKLILEEDITKILLSSTRHHPVLLFLEKRLPIVNSKGTFV